MFVFLYGGVGLLASAYLLSEYFPRIRWIYTSILLLLYQYVCGVYLAGALAADVDHVAHGVGGGGILADNNVSK